LNLAGKNFAHSGYSAGKMNDVSLEKSAEGKPVPFPGRRIFGNPGIICGDN
jgi:hypothetical protein